MAGEPEGTLEAATNVFVVRSFAEVEARAREVLREKGFSNELIEAQLARVNRDYPDWPSDQRGSEAQIAHKAEDGE